MPKNRTRAHILPLSVMALALASGASAQGIPPVPAPGVEGGASRQPHPPAAANPRPPRPGGVGWYDTTLNELLPSMAWNISARGPLLIISPEEVRPYRTPVEGLSTGGGVMYSPPLEQPLSQGADGKYNAEDVAARYDRKVVRLNTLAVFAPRTMTLLNDADLPKPNGYGGMTEFDKMRLLESTFTQAQWRIAASDNGIGAADLTEKQQALYLSLLPEPFLLTPLGAPETITIGSRSVITRPIIGGEPVTVSNAQRELVRLQFAKKLDWNPLFVQGGAISVGTGDDFSDTAYNYRITSRRWSERPTGNIYGGEIKKVVENRLKPSQLPSNWSALDVRVDLRTAKTVRELVAQIAAQTHVALHCDPRYADRTFTAIGDMAKASDVLKALNWALTSTWRRLDTDYVLTDDLVGLGIRQVKIDDWIQQNALLAQQRDAKVNQVLDANPYQSVGWSATDPLKPSDALIAKIDAYAAQPADAKESPRLLIPVADLPPAGQDLFRRQVAHLAKSADTPDTNPAVQKMHEQFSRPLRQDVVQMGVRMQVSYIVPGLGKVPQSNSSGNVTNPNILYKKPMRSAVVERLPQSPDKSIAFGNAPATRALLVTPKSAADLPLLAQEAHNRGFTQLWIDAPPGDTSLIAAGVQAGAAQGMTVYASVPLLRASASDSPQALNRNILGETVSQSVRRRLAEVRSLLEPGEELATSPTNIFDRTRLGEWIRGDQGTLALRNGEYLQPSPAVATTLIDAILKLADTPGLAGLALRDTAAPGFGDTSAQSGSADYMSPAYDSALQMGYTPDLRLACLQKNGFDPIDISPLSNGDRVNIPFTMRVGMGGMPPDMALPFFGDYGAAASRTMYNGKSGDTIGAKESWAKWCLFRHEQTTALIQTVRKAVTAHHPAFPVFVRMYDYPYSQFTNWYGSAEPPTLTPDAAPTRAAENAPLPVRQTYLERARAQSRVSYFAVGTPLQRTYFYVGGSAGWDGVVVDLGDMASSDVLDTLRKFMPTGVSLSAAPTATATGGP